MITDRHMGVVTQRWYEAMATPTPDKWRSLAGMLASMADLAELHEPNAHMTKLLRRMYNDAYEMSVDLQHSEVTA